MRIEILDPVESRVSQSDGKRIRPCLTYKAQFWKSIKIGNRVRKERREYPKDVFTSKDDRHWYFHTGLVSKVEAYCKRKNIPVKIIEEEGEKIVYKSPKLPGITLRLDQKELIELACIKHRGVIQAPTGCLTGDTKIRINRAKAGREMSLKNLFRGHHPPKYRKRLFNPEIKTFVRSYNGELILLQPIKDVVYSGKKLTYKLTLENGDSIKATKEHKFLTKRGWVELQHLQINDEIMCDSLYPSKSKQKKKKKKYEDLSIWNLWNHPYTTEIPSTSMACGTTKKIERSRITFEANLNNLSVEEYVKILRTDPEKSERLIFVNPKDYHIHHKDQNHSNNDIDNLEALTPYDHLSLHGKETFRNFNQGVPIFSKIKKIGRGPIEDTYDIICPKHHNFVANNMVVHNSGKTLLQMGVISCFPQFRILLLAHTIGIVKQTYDELKEKGFDRVQMICGGDDRTLIGDIVVSTMQSFVKIPSEEYCDKFNCVIVDEGHHISKSTGTYGKILSNLNSQIRLAFTATTPTSPEAKFALTGLIGPLIGRQTINEAADLNILAKPKIRLIRTPKNNRVYDIRNYREAYDEGIVNNNQRNKLVMEIAKEYVDEGKSVLIFVSKIEHGKNLQETGKFILNNYIPFVQGSMEKELRDRIKKCLIDKSTLCVISTTVWREGMNIPTLDVVINTCGGKSEIMTLQTIGRGLRKTEDKDEVIIVDFFDPSSRFFISHFGERICLYFDNNWIG